MSRWLRLLVAFQFPLNLVLLLQNCASGASPQVSSLEGFEHHPAIRLQRFASEPLVVDPAALTFDAAGDCYVVEMRDYPYGIGPNRQPGGTVRKLIDANHDGTVEQSHVFAEGLSFPTSVMAYADGILVLAPPEILYLKDTNGDHIADMRQVVLSGFPLGVTDSNANGLRLGPDGMVHVVNGGNGGTLTSQPLPQRGRPDFAPASLALGEADFAWNPLTGALRKTYQTGGGFGLVFDEFGNSFTTHNTNYLQQRLVRLEQQAQNPAVPQRPSTLNISQLGLAPRIYGISKPQTRVNHPEQAGYFSSAGGMGILAHSTQSAFSAELQRSVFVCDVVSNLVHRAVLQDGDSLLHANRAPEETTAEFIASTDNAFRPVGLEHGPDGALYLLDFHRPVIEHPDYIPAKVLANLDIRAGSDQGRIYRILPAQGGELKWPDLARQWEGARLIGSLASPQKWIADTAFRLMCERGAPADVAPLLEMLRSAPPPAQARTLQLLSLYERLDLQAWEPLLSSPNADVRIAALRWRPSAAESADRVTEILIRALSDPHPRVRFEAALQLDRLPCNAELNNQKLAGLLRMLQQDAPQAWSRYAVLLATDDLSMSLLRGLLTAGTQRVQRELSPDDPLALAVIDLAEFVASEHSAQSLPALPLWFDADNSASKLPATAGLLLPPLVQGLTQGWNRFPQHQLSTEQAKQWATTLDSALPEESAATMFAFCGLYQLEVPAKYQAKLERARTHLLDSTQALATRLEGLQLLELASDTALDAMTRQLLLTSEPEALHLACVNAQARLKSKDLGDRLVEWWPHLTGTARTRAIALWLENLRGHESLIRAVEQGNVRVSELNLDLEQRRTLLRHSAPDLQERAARHWADEEYAHRKQLVVEWLAQLPPTGDVHLGAELFAKKCAECHQAAGIGFAVGPPLNTVAHRSAEDLLTHILDPNLAIHPQYIAYRLETKAGEIVTGLRTAETEQSLTLLQARGVSKQFPRIDIASLQALQISLMPEGLEQNLTPQDLGHLIQFLQSGTAESLASRQSSNP